MIYEVALKKEQLFSDLFYMLTTYVNDLDKQQQQAYETICSLEKEIEQHLPGNKESYMSDVNTALNKTIEVLTELEGENKLTDLAKNEFDELCRIVLEGQEIECSEHIQVGRMIVCEGLPYQISEIDYEDFSVKLWGGDELDNGHWDSPLNCKAKI